MRQIILLLLCLGVSEAKALQVVVGKDFNKTVEVPGLKRVAVANSKIVKVRAVPPAEVLLTGKALGTTTVQVWTDKEQPQEWLVQVVPQSLSRNPKDRRPQVVKVALEFVEIDNQSSEKYGVRWPDVIEASASSVVSGSLSSSGLNYVVNAGTAKGWIEQLVGEGFAKILAKPSLYVRLGEEVQFQAGGEFPVTTRSSQQGNVFQNVEWKPFGLMVKVRPQSSDLIHLSSDVDIEISERDASMSHDDVPALTKRKLVTKMNSKDGEMVMLSGLVRRVWSQSKDGLPLLSKIPLIGSLLFGRENNQRKDSEVILAMTLSFKSNVREQQEVERLKALTQWEEP